MNGITIGTVLDGVRLDAVAGRGGTSVVYQATDLPTGELRAVKVLADPDPGSLRRLRREADLLARVDHAQLAPFYGLHLVADQIALVTGWCHGTTVRDCTQHRTDGDVEFARVVLRSVAAPLGHLHAQGIVHRDISPANVMVGPDGSFTLIDLGIGHNLGAATLTNNDLLAGTPNYLAPEIIRGEPATEQSDQYSLAMMIYEIAAGRSAFPDQGALATTLHHQLHTEPLPLDELDPQLTGAFADAVHRALSKDPGARFSSIHGFVEAAHGSGVEPTTSPPWRSPLAAAAVLIVLLGAAALSLAAFDRTADDQITTAQARSDEVQGLMATPPDLAPATPEPTVGPSADQIEPDQIEPDQIVTDEVGAAASVLGGSRTLEWTTGLAATLACNQLAGTDFSNGSVPLDYYGDPPGRERVVAQGGLGDSWALEVGVANGFGQFAEIVPVAPGTNYWFRGWFNRQGQVEAAEMGITLLDSNYRSLNLTVSEQIAADSAGFHEVEFADMPAEAAFALPYLFKDASPGVVIADELVFGVTASCFDEISTGGG